MVNVDPQSTLRMVDIDTRTDGNNEKRADDQPRQACIKFYWSMLPAFVSRHVTEGMALVLDSGNVPENFSVVSPR
jgi:hypothetical protein